MSTSVPVGKTINWDLRRVHFEGKLFFIKITLRPLHGRYQWMFYVQMDGNIKETSNYTATILVFRSGESPGEGEYCHRHSGDICPIHVSSVDEAVDQGYCLIVMDCLMAKLLVENNRKSKFNVWINIVKRSR